MEQKDRIALDKHIQDPDYEGNPQREEEASEIPQKQVEIPLELNKIYCVDCLEGMKKLPKESIDLVITSPPYYEKNIRGHGSYKKDKLGKTILEPMYKEWFKPFIKYHKEFFKELFRIMKKESIVFINYGYNVDYGWEYPIKIIQASLKYFKSRDMIIWNKLNPEPNSMGGLTHSFEFIFILHKTDRPLYKIEKGKYIKDVFNHKTQQINFGVYHGCPYPIDMIRKLIKISSSEGDVVLDMFLGTGTTCLAAKQLKRNHIGFEINPEYVKIANKRLSQEVLF